VGSNCPFDQILLLLVQHPLPPPFRCISSDNGHYRFDFYPSHTSNWPLSMLLLGKKIIPLNMIQLRSDCRMNFFVCRHHYSINHSRTRHLLAGLNPPPSLSIGYKKMDENYQHLSSACVLDYIIFAVGRWEETRRRKRPSGGSPFQLPLD
jgi:hypothetical protein